MPTLEGIIEDVEENKHSLFRIWLTSMPSEKFPITILQNGVKATIEPPKGLRNNIQRSFLQISNDDFESCEKPAAYKSLMWGLCFFNALILERRKFGPLGWNIPYEFSNSDLAISQAQLMMFLNHYEKIPWDALRYMVAEANYGGRVTDPNDRVTISLVLEDFYCPEMLNKNHKMSVSGKYFVPTVGELPSYIDFIKEELPINDLTEIFGLHENAEITSAIGITNNMLAVALTLQGASTSGGSGKSQDEIINELATDLLKKVPKNFDIETAAKKHPICYEDSMNTVLQQELLRYNRLISVVRSSLINVGKAIKGEVPLSVELEDVINSLFNNLVPEIWHKRAYPSLKPLASWIIDFLERLTFMQKWIDENAPPTFWISGFFFTQSFLTGAKQNYARKYVIAIDFIEFDFITLSDESKYDFKKGPDDGVFIYGMFTEGARWDSEREALNESMPKVLFANMKSVWVLPGKRDDIDYGHSYKCPVYKTQMRRGTLSTTGHSTNFVLYIYLPMMKEHESAHWTKRGVAMLTGLAD
jgi:dynein heavy chain